jgi:hypothetical protein
MSLKRADVIEVEGLYWIVLTNEPAGTRNLFEPFAYKRDARRIANALNRAWLRERRLLKSEE